MGGLAAITEASEETLGPLKLKEVSDELGDDDPEAPEFAGQLSMPAEKPPILAGSEAQRQLERLYGRRLAELGPGCFFGEAHWLVNTASGLQLSPAGPDAGAGGKLHFHMHGSGHLEKKLMVASLVHI